ncbi:MAG: RNA-binding S4 domain-containing protein [Magnetospirillum sp. WYHS-4]
MRIDKWLWHARFFKSRTLAGKACTAGGFRLNGTPTGKAHALVKPGDVLTFPLGPHIRVIRVVALGTRRGPAPEAQGLYKDLDPPRAKPPNPGSPALRAAGTGRPTKKERRAIERLRSGSEQET